MNTVKRGFAQALIDGWHGGWNMGRVVHAGVINSDLVLTDDEVYALTHKVLRVRYIQYGMPAKDFIRTNYRQLSDMLWEGRKADACVIAAGRLLGARAPYGQGAAMSVSVRAQDKRHDWGTVK